jgi:ABC-2 type transport system ATP-binding protein
MRRRLDIAMSLIGRPSVLFLDEPTTGLDPRSRLQMWDVIDELVQAGTTTLLTTQYLDEADELADRIAVLDGGRVVASGTPAELKRRIGGGHVRFEFADEATLARAAALFSDAPRDAELLTLDVPSDGSMAALRSLLDRVADAGVEAQNLTIHTPDLDDVFFALTGRAATSSTPASDDAQLTEVAR